MSEKPCISIIMPVYNAEKYLKEIFQCILNQSYQKWELIAVDDCSKDKSGKICDFYAGKDSRIRVIHLQKNSGAGNARNQGMDEATGEYITFVDADDEISSNAYEEVVEILQKAETDVVVWGVIEEYFNKEEQLISTNTLVLPEKKCKSKREVENNVLLLEQKTLLGYQWNKVYRSSLLKEHNIKFQSAILYEDYFFNIDFMKYAESMYIMNKALYHYKKRFNESITTKFIPEYFELSHKRVQVLNELCTVWDINEENRKRILGNIYLRYILSALMRNCDKKSKMTHAQRKQWVNVLYDDELFHNLIPGIKLESIVLKIMGMALCRRKTYFCLLLGRVTFIMKDKLPMIFAKVKRNR